MRVYDLYQAIVMKNGAFTSSDCDNDDDYNEYDDDSPEHKKANDSICWAAHGWRGIRIPPFLVCVSS